jgi:hypothetical protein
LRFLYDSEFEAVGFVGIQKVRNIERTIDVLDPKVKPYWLIKVVRKVISRWDPVPRVDREDFYYVYDSAGEIVRPIIGISANFSVLGCLVGGEVKVDWDPGFRKAVGEYAEGK